MSLPPPILVSNEVTIVVEAPPPPPPPPQPQPQPSLSLSVDKTKITLGEQVVFTVRIVGVSGRAEIWIVDYPQRSRILTRTEVQAVPSGTVCSLTWTPDKAGTWTVRAEAFPVLYA